MKLCFKNLYIQHIVENKSSIKRIPSLVIMFHGFVKIRTFYFLNFAIDDSTGQILETTTTKKFYFLKILVN